MKIGVCEGSGLLDVEAALRQLYGDKVAEATLAKTGPRLLRVVSGSETSLTLGRGAIQNLLHDYDLDLKAIGNLISVTESPDFTFPGNSPFLASQFPFQGQLSTYDLNAGCTGFVDALKIAGNFRTSSLIVCSETYSRFIREFDRATSSLFCDAAAAVLFDPTEWELTASYAVSDFAAAEVISLKSPSSNLHMDGKLVFNFVATRVYPALVRILEENASFDRVFLHQGSRLVVDFLMDKLGRFNLDAPSNIAQIGNSVSATIPFLIKGSLSDKDVKPGHSILLAGFGVGLYFSACVLRRRYGS